MNYLILLRHGQSQWNLENKFTGQTDVPLTKQGEKEAINAGEIINKLNIKIDIIFCSVLTRAIKTAQLTINQLNNYSHLYKDDNIIMTKDSALNERDYGQLVGLNKSDVAKKYGKEQTQLWRRSYNVAPPNGESLKNVIERVDPYFSKNIKSEINNKKNVLVVAHGNSLRAMLICLNIYKPQDISKVEIPTGKPYILKFDDGRLIDEAGGIATASSIISDLKG
tara:strand:+ start:2057 stop:2725 length:669 start_codon:yes stop_codon:yes gene_type:complete